MIEHDEELYRQALKVDWCDYVELQRLEGLCLSDEGRRKIKAIATSMYHREEASAGMI